MSWTHFLSYKPFFIAIACASWVLQLLVSVAEMRQDAELHVRYGHQS